MTAKGVFYPDAADTAEERLGLLRQPVPDRRGGCHLLRAAGPADRGALGRADAAGLHVRHQGPRADDRPADRGQAAAQGPARGPARSSSPRRPGSTPRTCPTTCATRSGRGSSMPSQPLAEADQLGSILLQYPRWFFTSSENRDTIEEATGRLRDAGLVGSVEFRSASWFNEKNIDRTMAFLGRSRHPARRGRRAAGLQVERPGADRDAVVGAVHRPVPRPADRDLGGEGHPDRGALPLPVRRERARGVGPAGPRRSPRSPKRSTSCSTTATRTTGPRTPSRWRTCWTT